MAYRTSSYSDFLGRLSALCGLDSTTLQTVELANFNSFFNKNLRKIWRYTHWLENTIIEQRTPDANYFINNDQASLTPIGEVFAIWVNNPYATALPRKVSFIPTATGTQLVGLSSTSAVYVYYRTRVPVFAGNTYSASTAYSSGTTVYYTTTAGVANYYTSSTSTLAGQSPETNPSSWSVSTIPYTFLEYISFASYADYLRGDGQNDKAAQADAQAEDLLGEECDVLQRQQRFIPPTDYASHLRSRPLY